ncbi:hypothetical protein B0J11DRAFT_502074 [Dendryphion nanum]|uniref:DUF6604 domain-containing protein n=1 Tax=Dendryphion nanum TaxID=256645 RepID=A0A9P9E9R1_9PLEO|nr:hypothetical protein B0J11DRAFT_502074 [Dendryphion nanum]
MASSTLPTLSSEVFSLYTRYKKGTDKTIQWLAEIARPTGKVDHLFAIPAGHQTNRRAKGKARKQHKGAVATSEPQQYDLSAEAVRRLAEVCACIPHIRVPRTILIILADVISCRKECAAYYKSWKIELVSKEKQNADGGHLHFIQVMQDVYHILKPKCAELEAATEQKDVKPKLLNLFEYLDVEDAVESGEPIEEFVQPEAKTEKQIPQATYKLVETDSDSMFAIYAFLMETNSVRLFIRSIWADYKSHRGSVHILAEVTNVGMGLLRTLYNQFVDIHPQFMEHRSILKKIHQQTGNLTESYSSEDSTSTEFLGGHVTQVFENSFILALDLKKKYGQEHSAFDYITNATRHPDWQLTPDEQDWFFTLVCYWTQASAYDNNPIAYVHDQSGQAFIHLRREASIPTWVVFTSQALQDVRLELGAESDHVLKDFKQSSEWIIHDLSELLTNGTNFLDWQKRRGTGIHQLIEQIKINATHDPIGEEMREIYGTPGDREDWTFYKNAPIYGGSRLQQWLLQYHNTAIFHCSETNAILDICHLYNAAQQSGLLPCDTKWQDIDFIIDHQGEKHLFVGSRPQAINKIYTAHCIARGMSLTKLTTTHQGQPSQLHNPKNTGKSRALEPMAIYASVTRKWKDRRIVETRAQGDIGALREQVVAAYIARHPHETEIQDTETSPTTRKKKRNYTPLSPLQILQTFARALHADALPLSFNLFALNERCLRTLREVRDYCVAEAPELYERDRFAMDTQLGGFVSFLFYVHASGFAQDEFPAACKILRKVVEAEGGLELERARERIAGMG